MIQGWWYPPGSSARYSTELSTIGDRFTVATDEGDSVSGAIEGLEISPRVGNITRRIVLPDQSLFETEDNDGVDQLLRKSGGSARIEDALHHLETRWRWISLAFIITLFIGFSTIYWGLPWASKKIAFSLPPTVVQIISEETLEILDKGFFDTSELPQEKKRHIREHFEKKLLSIQNSEHSFKLHFRKMGKIPNALALPDGTIIVTDRLVELADSQDEIDAILFHEIGHVVHRHALQRVLHSSFMTVAIIMVTGDVTVIENIAVALPVFLVESHYSRENETEADQFAFESMIQAGMDPAHFGRIMERISSAIDIKNKQADPPNKAAFREDVKKNKVDALMQYLSTHPATPERIQQANDYSERFKKGRSEETKTVSPLPESPEQSPTSR